MINQGISPIGELNLDSRLLKVIKEGKLIATSDLEDATRKSDIILMIVPTPVTESNDPDLSHIIYAGEEVLRGLNKGKLVVLESTVYPGVTEETLQPILEKSGLKTGEDFGLLTDALNENEKPVKNSKIVVLGLSYKENVGDARESPSEDLIGYLRDNKAQVTIVDPYINDESYVVIEKDVYKALEDADAMVLMTGHDEFRSIDFERVKKLMNIPIVIDGRRIYDPYELREIGFYYMGVGAIK